MSISQPDATRLPEPTKPAGGRIVHIDRQRRVEALERLLAIDGIADPSHVNRFIEFSHRNGVELEYIWSRQDDQGHLTHSVLAVPSPGRTAMFFASHPRSRQEIPGVAELISHAAEAMAGRDTHLAQALLDPSELLERETFLTGGFTELARLSYMERSLPRTRRGLEVTWPQNVTVEPYEEAHEPELLSVLDASYEQTLDCPDLRGLRETRDILEGHRSTGVFDPALWTLLRIDGRAAGALLMNSSPAQKTIELVYIGLAPSARGRGLGRRLLQHGLLLVAGRPERTINLAVDERNEPALALYRSEKFRRALRRVAIIRPLRRPRTGAAQT